MKKFNRDRKINFVDVNNVLVGYDLRQECCERADWFISEREEKKARHRKRIVDIDNYVFDTSYFTETIGANFSGGKMVRFKLICKDKPNLYLHLFNCHNGYYAHGFESKIGAKRWKRRYL